MLFRSWRDLFGCGYLIAFIVLRNQWRDEMIKRGVARYNWKTGKWEWGEPPKEGRMKTGDKAFLRLDGVVCVGTVKRARFAQFGVIVDNENLTRIRHFDPSLSVPPLCRLPASPVPPTYPGPFGPGGRGTCGSEAVAVANYSAVTTARASRRRGSATVATSRADVVIPMVWPLSKWTMHPALVGVTIFTRSRFM